VLLAIIQQISRWCRLWGELATYPAVDAWHNPTIWLQQFAEQLEWWWLRSWPGSHPMLGRALVRADSWAFRRKRKRHRPQSIEMLQLEVCTRFTRHISQITKHYEPVRLR
jgi:hypothetical protein